MSPTLKVKNGLALTFCANEFQGSSEQDVPTRHMAYVECSMVDRKAGSVAGEGDQ